MEVDLLVAVVLDLHLIFQEIKNSTLVVAVEDFGKVMVVLVYKLVALEEVVLVEMVEMVTILLPTWVQMQKIILDLVAVDRLDLEPQEELVMVVLEDEMPVDVPQ